MAFQTHAITFHGYMVFKPDFLGYRLGVYFDADFQCPLTSLCLPSNTLLTSLPALSFLLLTINDFLKLASFFQTKSEMCL